MQYQIITFGNGETLKSVLDAIAMCLNAQTGTLYTPLIRIGMIFGVLWAAIYSIWGDALKAWGKATLPIIFIPPLLFVPSTSVYIHDVISNSRDKVDHVPYGLAYAAHFISQIGFEITKKVDQVFSNVDDLKYHKSGFLMASNLIRQARTFRIVNEDVAENMREFVCQCVAYEAMLGYKYTFEDLRHSADLWGLISSRPSRIRSFIWKTPHKVGDPASPPQIISCQEGVKRFNQLWGGELDRAKTVLGGKLFGEHGIDKVNTLIPKQEFLKYLPVSYGFLSGLSQTADQILKQQMMIHAVVDGIEQKSVSLGNAPNFAARRAYLQQRSTYETLGAMAAESLMSMRGVLEAVVYASFIFLIPLAVLPFGVKVLLSWLQTLLWLQMWAPLYAVLNFMMSMGARSKSIGMLSVSNSDGVTIASSAGLMDLNADMAAMAGYLAMSIPFLAIALVKGVRSFVHMASHLGNVSQGAASQAAGDAVSGNYNFGNIYEGNQQIANTSMLTQSRAASYRSGATQVVDGRTDMTTMGDGSKVVNVGTSNLPISPNVAETQSAQQSEMATQARQRGLNLSESSAKNLTNSYRKMADLSRYLSEAESMNDGVVQGVSTEQSKDIQKGAQLINKFADDNNMNTAKAAELLASATIGGGFFLNVGGKATTSSVDQDNYQKAVEFAKSNNFHDAMRTAAQSSKNMSHNLADEASKKLATGISGSYETGMNERLEAQKSFQESESWNQQAMNTKANTASINANYNQPFVDWLASQTADHTSGHIGHRGAADIIANNPELAREYVKKFMAQKGLMPKVALHTNPEKIKEDYNSETRHQIYKPTQDSLHEVERQGTEEFKNNLINQGKELREKTEQTLNISNQAMDRGSSSISQEGSKVTEKVEAERGKSVTGKVLKKVRNEARETINDFRNIRKNAADDLTKLSDGEPQQK